MFATYLLYHVAGQPDVGTEDIPATCAVCGTETAMSCPAPFSGVFMDWDKLRRPLSDRVCPACTFAFSERLTMPDKEKSQRMRNYSHFVVNGEWLCLSKGQKAKMCDALLHPPDGEWLAVIGASGQKHVLFRAQVNHVREPYYVQFEETGIVTTPTDLAVILKIVEELYTAFSKTAISTGGYPQHLVLKFGLERWHALESAVAFQRGTPLLDLALFLALRREEVYGGTADTGDGSGLSADPAPFDGLGRVGQQETQLLEHFPGGNRRQRVHQRSAKVHQLDLFEDGH